MEILHAASTKSIPRASLRRHSDQEKQRIINLRLPLRFRDSAAKERASLHTKLIQTSHIEDVTMVYGSTLQLRETRRRRCTRAFPPVVDRSRPSVSVYTEYEDGAR